MSLKNLPPPTNNCKDQLCLFHTCLQYSVSDYILLQGLTHVQLLDTAQRDVLATHQLSKGILTQPLWGTVGTEVERKGNDSYISWNQPPYHVSYASVRFKVKTVVSTCQCSRDHHAHCRLLVSVVEEVLSFMSLGNHDFP